MSYMSEIASYSLLLFPLPLPKCFPSPRGQFFQRELWLTLIDRVQQDILTPFLKDVCVFFLSIQGNFHLGVAAEQTFQFVPTLWKLFYVKIVGDWFVSSSFFSALFLDSRLGEKSQRRANISSCISHREKGAVERRKTFLLKLTI